MKLRRRLLIIFGSFCLLVLGWGIWRVWVLFLTPALQVGPDTTVVTGPLRPNGTVDFEAAWNARCSAGTTPRNNAAILLEQAFGPAQISVELRPRYYGYLGIPALPEEGDYFLNEQVFAQHHFRDPATNGQKQAEFFDEIGKSTGRPWSRAQFLRVAAWIDANQQPIKLIEQAGLLPKCYSPTVSEGELLQAPMLLNSNLRSATRLLISRAMLRISEGDFSAALNDLLTCHRLAHLLNRNWNVVNFLAANAIARQASQGAEVLLAQALTVQQIEQYRAAVSALPPVRTTAEIFDQSERLFVLDSIQAIWKGRRIGHETNSLDGIVHLTRFDINTVLRRCNTYYDTIVKEMKREGVRDRRVALEKSFAEWKLRGQAAVTGTTSFSRLAWYSRTSYSESIADLLIAVLAPAGMQVQTSADRALTYDDLLQVGLALAAYRATRSRYPDQLTELKPDFLKQIPVDRYNDLPLHYKLHANGYMLYSVGDDGQDNGGQPTRGAQAGDIVFQVTHDGPPSPESRM